jgi:hypothetical protein
MSGSNETAERRVLTHRTVGNHLWVAFESVPTDPAHKPIRIVILALLARDNGHWGYKDMDENMGPNAIDCPRAVIEAVGPTTNEYALKWRARVEAHHAKKAEHRAMMKRITLGSTLVLKGCTPERFRITNIDGARLSGVCATTGAGPYKIPKRAITEVIPAP